MLTFRLFTSLNTFNIISKNQKKSSLGLKVANRFWTFLKMSILAEGRFSNEKNMEK
jgi:hypothetical protein